MKHLTIFLVICLAAATLAAQVPQKISYQGLLKTTSCTYVTDGNYDIEFKFYDLISGGTLKHTETLNGVPVAKGLFNVILGPLPMIFNEPLFVEITVLSGPDISSPLTFSPRTELTSVAYALNALTANPVGPAGGDLTGAYPDPTIKPDAVTSGKILDGTIVGGDVANGHVVRSVNKITDHITLFGKDGAAITSNMDTIFIHAGSGGGGGISAIQNTDGRLEVTDPTGPTATINISKSGASSGQALMYDGSNVVWQTPGGGGGLTLPYNGITSSTGTAFAITNTYSGSGIGMVGRAAEFGVMGNANAVNGVGIYGLAQSSTGFTSGVAGESNSPDGRGVFGYATANSGENYGVYGESKSPSGRGVYGHASASSGLNFGVYGESNSALGRGVVGYATASSGVNRGVAGYTSSTSGYGVFGHASASSGLNYGVYGQSNSASGRGVQGVSPYLGTYGRAEATTGVNYGVYGKSMSDVGYGVYGTAENTSGINYGVYGQSKSSTGRGVYGVATASSGGGIGVYGKNESPTGTGVYGYSMYRGVYGYGANRSTAGLSCGIYGKAYEPDGPNLGTYYAGYFEGKVNVQGTLSKAAGSFKIDHPLDPENKYLYHSFVESPDMMNIYNGNIILNDKGEAVVQLPDWFGALNKDFRYQLTCIGGFANIYIAEKVNKNQFKIAGGTNGLEVSWQVTGIRKDAFAEKNRIPIEEDKKGNEKGKYIHPEAFGLSKTRGIEALHVPQDVPEMKEPEMHDAKHFEPPTPPDIDTHEPLHQPPDIQDFKPPTPPNLEPNIE